MSEKIDIVTAVRNAEIGLTGKRYCTNCQVMRPAEYGSMINTGKINRWRCTACLERTNVPRYARKENK